jgi:hypothetical protein
VQIEDGGEIGVGVELQLLQGLRRGRRADACGQIDALVKIRSGQRYRILGLAPQRRFGLGLAVVGGEASLAELRVQEPAGSSMFNGKNFDGWWTPGKMDAWKMEKGVIVLTKACGDYLRSEKEYGNFTLSLEYKMGSAGNSGVGIRTPRKGWPSGDGMELSAIAAAVVGGTLITGGAGSISGALIGALIISTLSTGVVLMNIPFIPADNFEAVVGATIVLAAIMNNYLRKSS